MRKSVYRDLIILLTIFVASWAAFTYVPWGDIFSAPDVTVSIADEEKLGKLIVDYGILKDPTITIVRDKKIDSVMRMVTHLLVSKIGKTDFEYTFRIIKSDQVNAFTLPGGNIFIYTGLIEFCDSPEHLCAVLAHEIGHAEKRHVINKLAKELGLSLLFSVLGGNDNVMISEIGRTATSTVFDRAQEKEADDFSFQLMERSRINPKALAAFFRKLTDAYGASNEHLEILQTHPNNNSRIKASLEYKPDTGFVEKKIDIDWSNMVSTIKNWDSTQNN
ncbi:MAG: M48 family metallopeptidase [Bacteroidetes bacterium]|nr:MAG: M48 family metallopeptidase [Bacteroidota bacterium]